MLLNLLKSDKDYVKPMLIVLDALPIIATLEVATLTPLLDMKQHSKLGC